MYEMEHMDVDVVGMDVEIEEEVIPKKRVKKPKHKKRDSKAPEDSGSEEEVPVKVTPKKATPPKKSPAKKPEIEPLRISERTPKPSLKLKEAESSAHLLERSAGHRPSPKVREAEQEEAGRSSERTPKPSLRLKIKLAEAAEVKLKSPSKSAEKPSAVVATAGQSVPSPGTLKPQMPGSKKKKGKGKESGGSSDEERWLDAIESGKLEEVDDELKKIKDPKLMTARQRAMFEKKSDVPGEEQPLMALPSGYKEKVVTEEMLQKRALKLQRRKQQAEEKREKDKKMTMDRLLKKQASKSNKPATKKSSVASLEPLLLLVHNENATTISFPVGTDAPVPQNTPRCVPLPVKCAVSGCKNGKKYSCSQTGVPLCSLQCYKANLASKGLQVCQ
ncbi:INO80 complex subunit B [Neocloeon triangulifer]|uniref:INO80 complex subunit B n=1 Tax=Neocloeon triangulifer TaxID=2078957 RepID=UPI00286F8E91|nr:INO80 complex subunit B [Neocloeon triangulifer]XP_059488244.1 INO80 complex subunit B [Neocloeon triangulifer]